jgi:hypothetical protein
MRLVSFRGIVLAAAVAVLAPILPGCGDGYPPRAPISGQVLIDGRPVPCGTVCVVPKDARPAAGKIGPDGRFTLRCFEENDGAVLGTHAVTVMSFEMINPSTRKWFVPKKYQDAKTSGKTVTIDGPDDALVINLTWDGDGPFVERFVNGEWRR